VTGHPINSPFNSQGQGLDVCVLENSSTQGPRSRTLQRQPTDYN